jgi:hypothetical protein
MKTPEAVRDEAAKGEGLSAFRWCEIQQHDPGYSYGIEVGFKRGYDYAVKHDPRVLALVEAVTHFLDDTDSYDRYVIVVRALKAWEGDR